MKKSTKEMVKRLSQYIGKEIIRTGPNRVGSRSFLEDPIILKGFTSKGEIIYTYLPDSTSAAVYGTDEKILKVSYTDNQWKLLSELFEPKDNDLNQYIGHQIQMVRPAIYSNGNEDYSYVNYSVKLISATKYHLVVEDDSENTILSFEFAKPEDWVLAE